MPTSVTMPQLGESVTEGTVTRWLKQEGEEVQADEPLLEVSTDKVDTEIPSPASGVLRKIMVAEDETVQVGAELAIIGDAEDTGGPERPAESPATATENTPAEQAPAEPVQAEQEPTQPAQASEAPVVEAAAQDPAAGPDHAQPAAAQASAAAPSGDGSGSAAGGSGAGTSVTMPALGESVTEGTVTRWLKAVGDRIEADEPLLEVSTDKVDTEIPAPTGGTLLSISVGEDETVQVGAELAVIGSADAGAGTPTAETPPAQDPAPAEPDGPPPAEPDGPPPAEPDGPPPAEPEAAEPAPAVREDVPAAPDAAAPSESPASPPQAAPQGNAAPQDSESVPAEPGPRQGEQPPAASTPAPGVNASVDGGAYVTPLVRKLAAEHKVDLTSVTGTGVGGRIRKQDVLNATGGTQAGAPTPSARPTEEHAPEAETSKRGRTEKLTRLRALIGKRMTESLQVSAQLTTVVEVDLTRVARLRDRVKNDFAAREGVKLSFLPFFALAAVEALKAHPMVNSSIDTDAGTISYHDSENLGIAVDTERGLLVPVIHDAGDLNLGGIARKIADLAERTRNNKVLPDELGGGTFTLTNTGSRGALFDTPIINQPQVAILGTGTVVKRPVVVDDPDLGEIITVRSMVYLALTYDHRIVDGADAARFLVTMKERLEAGDFESSLGLS